MKRKAIIGAGLGIVAAGCAILGMSAWQGSLKNVFVPVLSQITGLQPGSEVSYSVVQDGKVPASAKLKADAQGVVAIPSLRGPRKPFSLDLAMEKDSKPVSLSISVDPLTGAVRTSGQGIPEFADVAIQSSSGNILSRADWSGFFNNESKVHKISPAAPYQIALGAGPVTGMAEENPLIVKILEGDGGGGPDDTNVNEYTNDYCGDPELSVCDDSAMQQQIDNIVNNYVTAFLLMGEQLTAVMSQYVEIIGSFFDAKEQLETQRLFRQLAAEAHKDYHPSEMMCRIGSYVKSVADTERRVAVNRQAFNKVMNTMYVNQENMAGAEGYAREMETRIRKFRETYCDIWDNSGGQDSGLAYICQHDPEDKEIEGAEELGGQDAERLNKDIDFTRTLDFPLTLDINFTDEDEEVTADEEDTIALARNIYWPQVLEPGPEQEIPDKANIYLDARRMFTVLGVAHNTFSNIVAMKASAPEDATDGGPAYMKSMMRELGLSDGDIEKIMGEYPSYYAQMEVLTKKAYESPDFYTNLLDKPVNVKRIGISLDAIKLMQMRDMYESSLRREMLNSMLVDQGVIKHVFAINGEMKNATGKMNQKP